MPSSRALAVCLLLLSAGCFRRAVADQPVRLSVEEVSALIPTKVADREGWARDVLVAFDANRLQPTLANVCAVVAVVEQESGFQANPAVPNLAAIARRELEARAQALGPLAGPVLADVLATQAPNSNKTFDQRLSAVRTEGDLDRLFRDLLAEQKRRHPVLYAAGDLGAKLFDSRDFDDRNPITTAGSMQVSVRFAEGHARVIGRDPEQVRDELYTRQGGLLYGAARLLQYPGDDDQMLYRFADYNAGFFASRNAAFQEQLSSLTALTLALDGDLLGYDAMEQVKNEQTQSMGALRAFATAHPEALSNGQLERDARKEKKPDFEKTATWKAVKRAWEAKHPGQSAAHARLPEVTLHSPKISHDLSTAWFARSVEKRNQACLQRADTQSR